MNLLSALPTSASEEHMCPHHAPTIALLRMCIVHAGEMGHITSQGIIKIDRQADETGRQAPDANDGARIFQALVVK